MSELTDALRQLADRIDRGEVMPNEPAQCALVLASADGMLKATYIGRAVPANRAGIHLLAAGIQRFNEDALHSALPVHASHAGSTH